MDPESVDDAERVPHGGADDVDLLDFSANVNPDVPPGVRDVYENALDASNRYPNDDYPDYCDAAADYVDCAPQSVVPTPGGLAAIRLALETRLEPGDSVLVPYPSFGEYAREVELQGAEPVFVPHDELLAADPSGHDVVIVCNPNNPTGDAYEAAELRAFVERCRVADTELLVDEAFLGFTEEPSLAGEPGVVVARSLTKLFGLPGIRAGFLVTTGNRLDALRTARRAWNLGTPAAAVGADAMQQSAFIDETRDRVGRERRRLRNELSGQFDVSPSDAPFLLLDVGERSVADVVTAARERGVALRDATTFRGLDSHVRVAVRTRAENERLVEVLEDV